MDSETIKVPVINFSNLEGNNWEEVKSKVHEALVEYGFFEAIFDKASLVLRKETFSAIQEIFDLPLETKLLNLSKKPYHGYFGQHPRFPLFEAMGIDDGNVFERVESITNILWPAGNPSLRLVSIYLSI